MAGNGTGYPYWFRCSKCRGVLSGSRGGFAGGVTLTGRTKSLPKGQRGKGHPRASQLLREYTCDDCGHTGWSRHMDLERKSL